MELGLANFSIAILFSRVTALLFTREYLAIIDP
jgi:hypothetical protein